MDSLIFRAASYRVPHFWFQMTGSTFNQNDKSNESFFDRAFWLSTRSQQMQASMKFSKSECLQTFSIFEDQ